MGFKTKLKVLSILIGIGAVLSAMLTFNSCAGKRNISPVIKEVFVHDSIIVNSTITIRDTVFRTPAANTKLDTAVDKLQNGFFEVRRDKNSTLTAAVADGKLKLDCYCDSLSIYAQIKDKLSETQKQQLKIVEKITEQKVPYVPWYIRLLAWTGGIALIGLAIRYLLTLLKIKS